MLARHRSDVYFKEFLTLYALVIVGVFPWYETQDVNLQPLRILLGDG